MFVADLPAQIEKLASLSAQEDLARLAEVIHQLKGSGGMYGYAEVTDTVDEAESIENITAGVQSLIHLIKRVEGFPETEHRTAGAGNNHESYPCC
jgi:HPt (histidine-containing phosphotransfer) domain-containing protein